MQLTVVELFDCFGTIFTHTDRAKLRKLSRRNNTCTVLFVGFADADIIVGDNNITCVGRSIIIVSITGIIAVKFIADAFNSHLVVNISDIVVDISFTDIHIPFNIVHNSVERRPHFGWKKAKISS
jgi:hypothetical protein